jgi:hypothetical protein
MADTPCSFKSKILRCNAAFFRSAVTTEKAGEGRRLSEREDGLGMPASENLDKGGSNAHSRIFAASSAGDCATYREWLC